MGCDIHQRTFFWSKVIRRYVGAEEVCDYVSNYEFADDRYYDFFGLFGNEIRSSYPALDCLHWGLPDALPRTANMLTGEYQPTLNSKIIVKDRLAGKNSSEGFYSYILKAFANKKEPQTIYMKAEFFHAGIGIKIPMVIATDTDKNAIQNDEWSGKLAEFKKGYDLNFHFFF